MRSRKATPAMEPTTGPATQARDDLGVLDGGAVFVGEVPGKFSIILLREKFAQKKVFANHN